MIQVSEISKSFGQRVLFESISFQIASRERVGLVGRNGSGKSTLFNIIAGKESYDSGTFTSPKNYQIATLDQHIHFEFQTVISEVCSVLGKEREFESHLGEKILSGLGFQREDFDKDPASFSGGYQVRISLAKVLLRAPNLLLLDEPTNYLDIISLRWLERFLRDFDGEVIIVTHDRSFMNNICTHVMGIHRKGLKKIKGNTVKYYEQLALDEEIHEQTRLNQDKKRKEMESFVERFKAKASKARQANSRKKMLEKMPEMSQLEKIPEIKFSFSYTECSSKYPLKIQNLSFYYQKGMELFSGLNITVGQNEKIAILGKNGQGKSTLLNCISGFLKPTKGEVVFHSMAKIGHFGQMNIERLHASNSIYQEVAEENTSLSHTDVRSICGSMLFSGDDADKKISVLSGGERARVMLAKILAKKTNILFLDEPTNHLDMESIDVLLLAIKKFPGIVLFVTHNEFLIEKVATKIIYFKNQNAHSFDGNYSDFLKKVGWEDDISPISTDSQDQVTKEELPKAKVNKFKDDQKQESIEEQIVKLEEIQRSFEKLIESKALKGEDVTELSIKLGSIIDKIDELLDQL